MKHLSCVNNGLELTSHVGMDSHVDKDLNEQYIDAIELLAVGVCHVGEGGRFIHVNQHLCKMLGYKQEELLALTVKDISHPDDEEITDDVRQKLHSGEIDSFKIEKRYLRKDRKSIWVGLTTAIKRDEEGKPHYDISLVEDISARKKAEARVQYLANYDELTDLPNRVFFKQLLTQSIQYAKRYNRQFGVLFIDLDRFKYINDSMGHRAGDQLLVEMARRFKSCIRSSDMVARLSGDEFVVLAHELNEDHKVISVAKKILSLARIPFVISGIECRVTASVGICMFSDGSDSEELLMQHADKAMYLAKQEGKNSFQFYTDELKQQSKDRLELESHLQKALELNEFKVFYQPRINIKTGEVCGAEALLRWNNEVLGEVSPKTFIALAEEMGLIVPLGKWVIKTACEQIVAWEKLGLPPLFVSVNLSPTQFLDPKLITYIADVIYDTQIIPERLELEITEGVVAQNPEQAIDRLQVIKGMGIKVAIDDFGTGYSSLSQVKQFPIDTLKIDSSFIRELPRDEENKAITEAIIVMSKLLNLTVVAEGVENEEQFKYLEKLGCDEIQGFYFGAAVSATGFEKYFK